MSAIDWILFVGFLAYVVWDGARKSKNATTSSEYFLAGRSTPWWAIGLSIMATQASAITMIGTTGQGFADGLRFVQFYFALPLAMLILAVTLVPLYRRHGVSTAYEYLGIRFDPKTRILSALLFLILRGLSVGFVIFTPSLVLAKVLDAPLPLTILVMGTIATGYTSLGGLAAVIRTDVKQMTVMVGGLVVLFISLLVELPPGIGLSEAYSLGKDAGRLQPIDLSWNPQEKYTLWSSLLGGLFLFLSYFGTDQSQVQRLLSSRSLRDARLALLLNGLAKVPFQFFVLSLGVLLFSFYTLHGTPLTFEPDPGDGRRDSADYRDLEERYANKELELRELSAIRALDSRTESQKDPTESQEESARWAELLKETESLREEARILAGGAGSTNYVLLDFVLRYLPLGIVGLLFSAIFAAALSSVDSEINSMTTVAVLDLYPTLRRRKLAEREAVRLGRVATIFVGAFATGFALYADQAGSLIEAVNRVGSYLYGSLLGAFVLALYVPRAHGHGAFFGILVGVGAVAFAATTTDLAFLYLNTLGVVVVVFVGTAVSAITPPPPKHRTP